MPQLRIHLFGPPYVTLGDVPVETERRKALALLAYLAVTRQNHTRSTLAALLWPDAEPGRASANLRQALWEINHVGDESWALADREVVGLNPEVDVWTDVAEFQTGLAAGPALEQDCAAFTRHFSRIVALYTGDFLSGFGLKDAPGFDEWVFFQAEGLRRDLAAVLEKLVRCQSQLGAAEAAIADARHWLALDPLNEGAHRALMRVYEQANQHNAALRQYQECARILRDQLSAEPEPETTALYEKIRAGEGKAVKPAARHNLPTQLTSFVGREKELAEVGRLVAANRLVTLTGSGGCGKTRLSIEAASSLLAEFPDGVWLIQLAPLADPALVPRTVAATLGLSEEVGRPIQTSLAEFLRVKKALLVLDNCEHLIDACAQLSESLLHASPNLRILASSREALGIAGEAAVRVPSLTVPDPAHRLPVSDMLRLESVRLFVERAAAAQAGFALTEQNTRAVAEICTRLDGIPLAIELAATRVKALSVAQIAARLDDRFRLLTGGSRTALPRHQTLRALIDWSHSLLSEPERILLRRLSVFAGGWTLESAEEVAGRSEPEASAAATSSPYRSDLPRASSDLARTDVLDLHTRLVEKSLVVAEALDGELRYHMLETIRQYARDKLLEAGETEQVRQRHLEYFLRLGDLFDANILGPEDDRWSARLESELDNVRAAVDWSLDNRDALSALRLAGSLRVFWFRRHPGEAIQRVGEILSLPEAALHSTARAWALSCYGTLLMFLAQPEKYDLARQAFEEMLAIARELGDERATISALDWLGWTFSAMGNYAAAQSVLTEALSRARLTADQLAIGIAEWYLGEVAFSQDEVETAQSLFEAAAASLRAHGAKNVLGGPTLRLAQVALRRGDYRPADKFIQESLALLRGTGDLRGVAMCLAAFAALRMEEGRVADAARLCGAVDALLESLHTGLLALDQAHYEQTLAELRTKLDAAAFTAAWAEGHALNVEQAIALAATPRSLTSG